MKNNLLIILLFLAGVFPFGALYSQMEKFHVNGDMKDGFTDMSDAFVIVYSGGQKIKRIDANSSGKFEFDLEFGRDYVLEFRKQYYATKKVDIFLGAVKAEMIDIGCRPGPVQVGMIKKVDGIDYSVLDKSVGKIFYEPESKCFDWDADYSLRVMEKLETLQHEMEEKQDTYDKNTAIGSKALAKGDYAGAAAAIAAAKAVFPNDAGILKLEEELEKAKKAAADKEAAAKLEEERKKQEAEAKAKQADYDKQMAAGDKAMKSDDFEGAKAAYSAAAAIIPTATAHQTKLQILADTQAKRLKEAEDAAAAKAAEEAAKKKAEEEDIAAKAAEEEAKKKAEEEAAAAKIAEDEAKKKAEAEATAAKAAEEEAKKKAEDEAAAAKAAEEEAKKKAEADAKEKVLAEKAAAKAEELKEKEEIAAAAAAAAAVAAAAGDKEKEEAIKAKAEADRLKAEEKAKAEEEKAKAEEEKQKAQEVEAKKKTEEQEAKKKAEAEEVAAKLAEEEAQKKAAAAAAATLALEQAKKEKKEEPKKEEPKKEEPKKEEPKKEEPKKEEPKKEEPKKEAPIPTGTKVAASAGVAAAAATPGKSKIHKDAKEVKSKGNKADMLAALDAAAMKQNPTTTSVQEHHDWDKIDPNGDTEIAKEYPDGVTEEVYMQGKKEITERVVVKNGKGNIYSKIKHPWGGVYYFKNGTIAISAIDFDLFTTLKDENGDVIPIYHIDRVGNH